MTRYGWGAFGKPGGPPRMFETPVEMQVRIDEYLQDCPDKRIAKISGIETEIPDYTITGLCLFLGFCDRRSFYDYEGKPEFAYTVKRARMFIEHDYERLLKAGGNPIGAIFGLKNVGGWVDKQELDLGLTEETARFVMRLRERKPESE